MWKSFDARVLREVVRLPNGFLLGLKLLVVKLKVCVAWDLNEPWLSFIMQVLELQPAREVRFIDLTNWVFDPIVSMNRVPCSFGDTAVFLHETKLIPTKPSKFHPSRRLTWNVGYPNQGAEFPPSWLSTLMQFHGCLSTSIGFSIN